MTERVVHFGDEGTLMGVLATPAQKHAVPGVVLLNAGLIHRVGPNRLYVSIARRLTELGYPTLRFDMSGIGDSPVTSSGLSGSERAQKDVAAAVDALVDTTGCEGVVAMGLCSGAMAAHAAALRGPPVVGCVQIDGYMYETRGFLIRNYLFKVLDLGVWKRRILAMLSTPPDVAEVEDELPPEFLVPFNADMPTKEGFATDVKTLIDAGQSMLFVLSSGGLQEVNYRRQLHDCVRGVDLDKHATVVHFPNADHTFTGAVVRTRLLDRVAEWMTATFTPS